MAFLEVARKIVALGGAASALIFLPALVLVSIFDIVGRRIFFFRSMPLQEFAWHFFFACAMFGVGYGYVKERHVRVDILRNGCRTA